LPQPAGFDADRCRSTYVGNSPIDGYFQLVDLNRVEVLRGPQGTLYGAGALGGALRLIPNSPQLDKFAGSVEISGARVAHSSGNSWGFPGAARHHFHGATRV
jgi:iron complex outermembrane recepter protein